MKILSIGLDRSLFDKNSDSFWRLSQYATWFSKYTVTIATLKQDAKAEINFKNIKIIPTNSSSKFLFPFDTLLIAIRSGPFNLVTTQDPFICAFSGILVKYFLHIPLNIQIHSEFFNSKYFRLESPFNFILYCFGRLTLPFADTVRARNKRIGRLLKNVFYVPMPVNEVFTGKLSTTKRDPNLVIFVGRFVKQKNLPLLFSAMKKVKLTLSDVKLILIGDGPKDLGFVGWKTPQEIKQFYDKASLLVLPSNHEGWSMVVCEALTRGCPVVMTDTGCANEIVINDKSGYVVPVGNTEVLAEKIIKSLSNQPNSLEMALVGREMVQKNSDLKFIKQQSIKMYQATISSRE